MIPRFKPTATTGEIVAFLGDLIRMPSCAGPEVVRFEETFARYIGVPHAVFVPSGRMGLWLILKACGYPPGSEIVLPAFTYFAIPAVVRAAGLTPVYADIEPDTYELSPGSVEKVLTGRTCAVVPTHLFGRTCDIAGLKRLCAPGGIDLIEDCAQSCGATVGGRMTGSLTRAAYFTFGITKNFTTFSGAMVTCADKAMRAAIVAALEGFAPARRTRLFKEAIVALGMQTATARSIFNISLAPILRCGAPENPDLVHRLFEEKCGPIEPGAFARLGWRPVAAQARAGMRQLLTIDAKNAARRRHGAALLELLKALEFDGTPAAAEPGGDHVFMSFAVRCPDRYRAAARLRRMGVDVSPGYMIDCASVPDLGGRPGLCPNSQSVHDSILHLPLYPELRPRDIERIVRAIATLKS